MVRSSPRARAGFSRLAASPCPACPPAPIMVCASSMNRMMGVGDDLHFFDQALQAILEFALDARARLQQRQVERAQGDVLAAPGARRRAAMRSGESFDDRRLADARFAHQDRIVLPPAGQDVDHLADFEIAAQHRIDLALPWRAR